MVSIHAFTGKIVNFHEFKNDRGVVVSICYRGVKIPSRSCCNSPYTNVSPVPFPFFNACIMVTWPLTCWLLSRASAYMTSPWGRMVLQATTSPLLSYSTNDLPGFVQNLIIRYGSSWDRSKRRVRGSGPSTWVKRVKNFGSNYYCLHRCDDRYTGQIHIDNQNPKERYIIIILDLF